jgi:hypothetical protein
MKRIYKIKEKQTNTLNYTLKNYSSEMNRYPVACCGVGSFCFVINSK